MPLTDEDIAQVLRTADRLVNAALPPDYAGGDRARADRQALRTAAFTEVLRELLAQARVPQMGLS